jgi:hypothetical protein
MTNNTKAQATSSLLTLIGGVLLVCAFAIAFIYLLNGGQTNYGVTYNETAYQGFNQSKQIINLTQSTQQQFIQYNSSGSNGGNGVLDIITVVTSSGYNTLKIIGTVPGIYHDIINNALVTILGVPAEIADLIFYFVMAVVISVFILLVFRVRS